MQWFCYYWHTSERITCLLYAYVFPFSFIGGIYIHIITDIESLIWKTVRYFLLTYPTKVNRNFVLHSVSSVKSLIQLHKSADGKVACFFWLSHGWAHKSKTGSGFFTNWGQNKKYFLSNFQSLTDWMYNLLGIQLFILLLICSSINVWEGTK